MRLSGEDLACERGGRMLFSGLSFTLEAGQGMLIEGPNGSGKTTLIRAIAGLGRFARGHIALSGGVAGVELDEQAHYVGHADAVKPQLSVTENLAFWAGYLGGGDIGRALDAFGLHPIADLPAQVLSAGQRRKLALSRLALVPRLLWLLDEPSVSLDRAAQQTLAGLMAAHVAGGGLLMASTHMDLGTVFSKNLRLGAVAA
ncbi:MAG: heme ABC exporter ATP-binding protein CcmA [Rhodobiaceae bacterium]|nr:heme ABC exporter ATP-binding protein CcmA [Rhodobiaceae bacterium]